MRHQWTEPEGCRVLALSDIHPGRFEMRTTLRATAVIASGLLIAGCAAAAGPQWTYAPVGSQPPAASGTAAAGPTAAPTQSPGAASVVGHLDINSFDLGFDPALATVAQPGRYEVTLHNEGAIDHDITIEDGTHIHAAAGETATGILNVTASGLDFWCSIVGHADAGMKGHIAVSGGTAVATGTPTATANPDDHGGPAPTSDIAADPNAPPPARHDPTAPELPAGETHDIELPIVEQDMTVATGFVQHVWTFDGSVPGPVIRVKVGDLVRVHLINPPDATVAHSIDFHASMVAWNDEMTSIAPGEEKIYEFRADYAGVWMYHCGTAPALHHIANGMYGMIIVEPREGLSTVDHEFALVQSEWYLGPQGQPVSLSKASAAAPAPDFVVFNGVANQYVDGPIVVPVGERVRLFVLDAGPSVDSSFHIVGTIFDRVIKEGIELALGNPGNWGSQAVDLSPAQGAVIEFTLAEEGLYPIVTHAFNFVGRGALGLFQAGDGDPLN
jgi:nitrite reductase (NO-forming)